MSVETVQTAPEEAPVAPSPVKQPHPAFALIKDAAIWGAITVLLTGPIIGLKTVAVGGRYVFEPHWGVVFSLAAIVFFGRIFLNLTIWRNPTNASTRAAKGTALDTPAARAGRKALVPLMILVAIGFPFLSIWLSGGLQTGRYWIDLGILVMTYVLLGWGLNIVVGLAGLLDLGYVAFYAVGAYSFAILSMNFGMSFWVCLPLAGLFAAMFGIMLGFPVLRLRGDYLAIVTLAFGEIIRLVLINWREFSGGASGINQIPRPSFFGLEFTATGENSFAAFFGIPFSPVHRLIFFYYVILALAFVTLLVTIRLRRLPIGRAWEALREDEIACRSLGISVVNTKLTAFALGAMFGGFAGTVFAARQGYISPNDFSFLQSALIVAIVVLGGLGSNIGVVFSALVMIGGIEMLRNLGFVREIFGPGFDPTQYRMLIFGLVMVVIMVWKPRGLISSRSPTVFLKEKKIVGADMVSEGHG
ncbi:high-affinity branched-chain amino acid ABC transporter permease LivM [Terrihabitans rhizophilus]|uniref:High-affinity branched-chain amino acid ABC transporter permease LivM n=1 Tax=Terrihabitans rhizophilus TaxID=3092662 RepID=A0ABU4RS99_9HYPH|nr:high-affinity branched-chain amino acid ABC transporter permease LivM [Terrihabitans sp. PJ23]MDX6805636.1 high-affinity branched-chain amino acid ABC transporter permease LivM [Terrihabitans sp. PJ23]